MVRNYNEGNLYMGAHSRMLVEEGFNSGLSLPRLGTHNYSMFGTCNIVDGGKRAPAIVVGFSE